VLAPEVVERALGAAPVRGRERERGRPAQGYRKKTPGIILVLDMVTSRCPAS
jgi:hypothetical protein